MTSIGGAVDTADSVAALLVYAETFGLTDTQGRAVLGEVALAASDWAAVARRHGIPEAEITRFSPTLGRTIAAVLDQARAR